MDFKHKLTKAGIEKSGPGYLLSVKSFKEHTVILAFFLSIIYLPFSWLEEVLTVWQRGDYFPSTLHPGQLVQLKIKFEICRCAIPKLLIKISNDDATLCPMAFTPTSCKR